MASHMHSFSVDAEQPQAEQPQGQPPRAARGSKRRAFLLGVATGGLACAALAVAALARTGALEPRGAAKFAGAPGYLGSRADVAGGLSKTAPSRPANVRPQRTDVSMEVVRDSPVDQIKWRAGKVFPSVRADMKSQLLDSIASGADEDVVLRAFRAMEAANPVSKPLSSPLLSGDWHLVWTTSASIRGETRPSWLRPLEAPLQSLDIATLSAENAEVITPLRARSSVDVKLTPKPGGQGVYAKFTKFKVGPVAIKAGDKFTGELDVTYLDEEVRLSRGDKGNLFVLLRDKARADEIWRAFQQTLPQ